MNIFSVCHRRLLFQTTGEYPIDAKFTFPTSVLDFCRLITGGIIVDAEPVSKMILFSPSFDVYLI